MFDWSSLKQNNRFLLIAATAVGSISVAAAIAWIYKRRKIMSKGPSDNSDSSSQSSPISKSSSSTASSNQRSGRRNYRQEEESAAALLREQSLDHTKKKTEIGTHIVSSATANVEDTDQYVADPIQQRQQQLNGGGDHRQVVMARQNSEERPPSEPNGRPMVPMKNGGGGGAGDEQFVEKKMQNLTIGLELDAPEPILNWSEEVERSAREASESGSSPLRRSSITGNSMVPMPLMQNLTNNNNNNNTSMSNRSKNYRSVESPSLASMHSEQSADSGRATGGLASSMSPVDNEMMELPPMYEFEIPNTLVGLIIGIKGKTIKELCTRCDVRMIIRPHHTPSRVQTHQICTVEGRRDQINKCLQMLRRRFPPSRFPDLNLKPVLPPPINPSSPCSEQTMATAAAPQPTSLTIPESVNCEVVLSAMVDAGHFFLQQPTHPRFSDLERLDSYMLNIYTNTVGIPELPRPCETGTLCVATIQGRWHRAVTVHCYPHDEVLVRFVDYGGYARLSHADLRQIRTDLIPLPFQAVECYLANVMPVDGNQWSDDANALFKHYTMQHVIEAYVAGYDTRDGTPLVELYTYNDSQETIRIDQLLIKAGLACPVVDVVPHSGTGNSIGHSSEEQQRFGGRPVMA